MSNVLHTLSPWSVSRSDSGWRLVRHGSSTGVTLPVTGSTLWVDAVYGNDDTGTRGRFDRPYESCTAAKAAASSGDTIHVRPGTYNERNLLKNGVNWHFEPGASVTYTGTGDGGIWDDSSVGANGAVTCLIGGAGRFRHATTSATVGLLPGTTPHNAVRIENASSNVTIRCRSISTTNSLGEACGVLHKNGTLTVESLEPIAGEGTAWGVWWEDGPLSVTAPQCTGTLAGGIGLNKTGSTATDAYFRLDKIAVPAGTAAWSVYAKQGHDNGRVWFFVNEVSGYFGIDATAGRYYLTCQKLASQGQTLSPIAFPAGGGAVKFWLTAQKITVGRSGAEFTVGNSGYLSLDIGHGEDIETSDVGAALIRLTATGTGKIRCRIGEAVLASTRLRGVQASGDVLLSGTIDGSASASGNPLDIAGSGVTLGPIYLRAASGQDSITASGGAVTVTSSGSLAYNLPPHADVTITSLVAGGLAPAGSGSELQYRASASTLGALTGSSVSGSALTVISGFVVRMSGGVAGQDEIQVGADSSNSWVYSGTGNQLLIGSGGTYQNSGAVFTGSGIDYYVSSSVRSALRTTRLSLDTAVVLDWGSGGGGGTADTGIVRIAAGVVELNNGTKAGAGKTLRSLPLSPSQITGNQNDYAPGVAMHYRLSTDASRNITGLSVGQVDGQQCEIWNVGAQDIVLVNQSGLSTDVNRFANVTGADLTLSANQIAQLRYDATTQRWRVWEV